MISGDARRRRRKEDVSVKQQNHLIQVLKRKKNTKKVAEEKIPGKGAFTIYVYKFSHIFDHPPTFVYKFHAINVYKFAIFLTTHPPGIVNINFECPLIRLIKVCHCFTE